MAYITLSRSNYFHNLSLLADKCGGVDKLSVVLKDNAYGHGLKEMATLASEFGVTKAVVRDEEEALEIKEQFEDILVLAPRTDTNPTDNSSLVLNSLEQIYKTKPKTKVYLKIDSGMRRNGITADEISDALKLIISKALVLKGVMTHFATSDESGDAFEMEMQRWLEIKNQVKAFLNELNIPQPSFSSLASHGVLRVGNIDDEIVRCGIATYGYNEFDESFKKIALKPVLKLYAEKISSRVVKPTDRVGYGKVGTVAIETIVSSYDIGYGDGFFRYDGKSDFFTPEGDKIVGRISMDITSVASDKDEIVLLDDAKVLADRFSTISYDILVKLSPRIKRVVID